MRMPEPCDEARAKCISASLYAYMTAVNDSYGFHECQQHLKIEVHFVMH